MPGLQTLRGKAAGAGALALALAWASPGITAPDPGPFVAFSPDATSHILALADRMLLGGALLVLFVILAGITFAMWRDTGRRGGRT